MKANELRIGNFVYLKSKQKIFGISSGYEIDTGTDSEDFEPIPLTEEWLLKFGFELCDAPEEQGYQKGEYRMFKNDVGEFNFCLFEFGDWYQKIESVHELQNLYLCLCGEELNCD